VDTSGRVAGRRCLLHGTFPSATEFGVCPVCGNGTDYIANIDPDENWESNAARMREWLDAGAEPVPDIPILKDGKHIRVRFDGQYWLHSWDVVRGGLGHRLTETDLVQVGKQTFEVLAYVDERREYLVRPFSLELTDEDMRKLQCPDS
jgi:hypothetical protein